MLINLLIFACTDGIKSTPQVVTEINQRQATTLHPLVTNHSDSIVLQARITDDQYFAVSDEVVTFQVDTETYTTTTDAFGYASVEIDTTELAIEAIVQWEEQTGTATAVINSNTFAISGYRSHYMPQMSDANYAIQGTDGMLLAYGNQIWWTSNEVGFIGHQIANLPEPIAGMWSDHIDKDGILDAVAWTDTTAYLLRGRPEGGFSLGGEFTAPEGQIIAMSIGNLNEGNHTDIAVGVTLESDSYAIILEGDGAWDFTPGIPLEMTFPIEAMVAAEENGDDLPDITVIDSYNGWVRRYTYSIEGWIGGLPSIIDPSSYIALPGTYIPPTIDINGDDRRDLLVYGGQGSSAQDMVFFVINEVITKYDQSYAYYNATTVDIDGNGSDDILALSDESLHFTSYNIEEQSFSVRNLAAPPITGPLMTGHFNEDELLDLRIFAEYPIETFGGLSDAEFWNIENLRWEKDNTITIHEQHFATRDFDDDGNIELVGVIFNEASEQIKLQVWEYDQQSNASQGNSLDIGNTSVLDFAYCEGYFLLLEDDGTTRNITSYTMTNDVLSSANTASVEQNSIDCANINGNLRILLSGGTENTKTLTANLVQIDEDSGAGLVDADIGDGTDGLTQTIIGCAEVDCQVEIADLDGDGSEEIILKNSTGVTIQGWGDDILLGQTGLIDTLDINGDGAEELLIRPEDSAFVWIYQGTAQHISSIFGIWIEEEFLGLPQLADITGNGSYETLLLSSNDEIFSSWFPE